MKVFSPLSLLALFAGTVVVSAAPAKGDDELFVQPHIYNGETAYQGQFPYFVDLETCSAQLIAPRVVLTAAHCNAPENKRNLKIGQWERGSSDFPVQVRKCIAWLDHPDWDGDITNGSDYALCYLNKPVRMYPNVTLTLNEDPEYPPVGTETTAIGMGYRSIFFGLPRYLQYTELPIIATEDCGAQADEFDETILCTSDPSTSTCGGDSGGPLVTIEVNEDGTETHKLVGITSFGYGIFCPTLVSGFARISAGLTWIKDTICGNGVQADFCDGYVVTDAPSLTPF